MIPQCFYIFKFLDPRKKKKCAKGAGHNILKKTTFIELTVPMAVKINLSTR
jgi:hypothetical protein